MMGAPVTVRATECTGATRLAELAVEALHADAVVVVFDGGREPPIIVGEAGDALMARLRRRSLAAADRPREPADGGDRGGGAMRLLSIPFAPAVAGPGGTLYVGLGDREPAPTAAQSRLARGFASHISLAHALASCPPEAQRDTPESARALAAVEELLDTEEPIEHLTARIREILAPLLGVAKVGITVRDGGGVFRGLPGYFSAGDAALTASIISPVADMHSNAARVWLSGQPYVTNRCLGDPGTLQGYVRAFGLERLVSVPLRHGGRPVGVLHVANKPSDFTLADVVLVARLACKIGTAVQLVRNIARMREQQRFESILADAAVAIALGRSPAESLAPAFAALSDVIGTSLVALVRVTGKPLIWRAGDTDDRLEASWLADARRLGRGSAGAYPQGAGDPGWSALHTPVVVDSEARASLSVLRGSGEPFSLAERDMLGRLASLAALTIVTQHSQRHRTELTRAHERERIANELHDHLAQLLFAAQLGLDAVLEHGPATSPDTRRVTEVRELLVRGDAVVREVIGRLAPEDPGDLVSRLELAVEEVRREFGVAVELRVPATDVSVLRDPVPEYADCVLRVVREATVNAAKHAWPCQISVEVHAESEGQVQVTVLDDGPGPRMARAGPGHGIRSLRRSVEEVGGVLCISARRESCGGTEVSARVPLQAS